MTGPMNDFENIAFVCRTCGHDFDLLVSSQKEIDDCLEQLGCVGHDIELASYELETNDDLPLV